MAYCLVFFFLTFCFLLFLKGYLDQKDGKGPRQNLKKTRDSFLFLLYLVDIGKDDRLGKGQERKGTDMEVLVEGNSWFDFLPFYH